MSASNQFLVLLIWVLEKRYPSKSWVSTIKTILSRWNIL